METLFSLGALYPSDFLRPEEKPRCEPIELKLVMDDEGFVKLEKTAPKESMWGERYWYKSGISQTMKLALQDIVNSILPLMQWEENDIWLDIACNDGTMLSYVPKDFIRIGIDPSSFPEAQNRADLVIKDYFSTTVYRASNFGGQKAKIITSIAMFYDLEKPEEFIKDVHEILEEDGLWVMQLSYSPLMISQLAFDNICHEHIYYYSLFNLNYLLDMNGFQIVDCQLNDVNGGSFRVYIMKSEANIEKFSTQPYRDVARVRIDSLLAWEEEIGMANSKIWDKFYKNIQHLKKDIVEFIKGAKLLGHTVWAYGMSTKGNTLLQYFGLDNTLIDGGADRNRDKWGLRTVGTNIQIHSESDMREAKPDFLLILPWHFLSEFKEREKELLESGTKFIMPCPKFEIITK